MSKIIIGIHGLGPKPSKELLSEWWEKAIFEGLARIGKPRIFLNFELVYWAHILHPTPLDPNEKDKDNPFYLDNPYMPAKNNEIKKPSKFKQKIIAYLAEQLNNIFLNEDFTLNFAGVTDLIIHRYFKDLDIYYQTPYESEDPHINFARDLIRDELVRMLKKHRRKKIMLIAHSMGSIVAYDVLTKMLPDIEIDTLVTIGSPLGLPVVISKIVSEQHHELKEQAFIQTPENVKKYWYNFSDIEDKIAIDFDLAGEYQSNSNQVHVKDILISNDYEYDGEVNPHNIFGYLRTPDLSEVIDEFFNAGRVKLFNRFIKFINSLSYKFKKRLIVRYD